MDMYLRARALTVLLVFALLSTGCRKYLDFEGEDLQPRLVLNGLAIADSVLTVQLTNSRGVIDPGALAAVTNGQVRVFDDQGDLVEELVHVGEGKYRGTVTIVPGSVLAVKAEATGLEAVQATDRVPLAVPVQQWDTATIATNSGGSGFDQNSLEITLTINDPGDRSNFYLIEGFVGQDFIIEEFFDPISGTLITDTIFFDEPVWSRAYFSTTDQVLISESGAGLGETRVYFGGAAFRDQFFNGNTRTFTVRLEGFFRSSTLDLRLVSISEAAFRYYRTLERYAYADGDPFSEPVQVFTNVQGGLGIWAGTNVEQVIIEIW